MALALKQLAIEEVDIQIRVAVENIKTYHQRVTGVRLEVVGSMLKRII